MSDPNEQLASTFAAVMQRLERLERRLPSRYGVHSTKTTNTSIPNGTVTTLAWNNDVAGVAGPGDPQGFRAGGSTSGRFKVPVGGGGLYVVEFEVWWDSVSNVDHQQIGCHAVDTAAAVDTARSQRGNVIISTSTTNVISHETWLMDMPEGYEFQPWVYQGSGGARNVLAINDANGPLGPYFKAYRIAG